MKNFLKLTFIILAVFPPALFTGCSDDNDVGMPPVINSITPDTVSMGDTMLVEGSRFNVTPWKNRIAFSPGEFPLGSVSRYSVPFEGGSYMLRVVVPEGVFSGSVRAEQLSPIAGLVPMGGGEIFISSETLPLNLTLNMGDVAKAFFCSEGFDFPLSTGGAKRHLMIVFSNSVPSIDMSTNYSYSVEFEGLSGSAVVSAAPDKKPVDKRKVNTLENDHVENRVFGLDRKKREETIELLRGKGEFLGRTNDGVYSAAGGESKAPESMEFDVFSNYDGSTIDPASYTKVQADLKYEGSHTLLYLDSSTDPGCITDLEAEAVGREFDMNVYQTDREYYGGESDINGDEKVAILMSPVINELTPEGEGWYIAGFFLPTDLMPSLVDADCSNAMEIFYTVVPDPGGIYGNVLPKEKTMESIESILGHEFLHMIMFNYRVLAYSGTFFTAYSEELWLEEGLAHIAEHLNGHFADNIGRADEFLIDPGNVSIVYGDDSLARRGAAFLFLRYLGDRFGDTIFKELVQSKLSGIENIENVIGEDFIELFADWSAALYLSGKGIPADSRFEYSSIDLQADFAPLNITGVTSPVHLLSGDIRALAPEFIEFNLPTEASYEVLIQSGNHGRMNAVIIRR